MNKIIASIIIILLSSSLSFSFENLTEIENRKARQATNPYTKESLEDATAPYVWNPETLMYTDIVTGKEVWRLSGGNNITDYIVDIGWAQYSADGSKISLLSKKDCYGVTSGQELESGTRMVMDSSGANPRPIVTTPAQTGAHSTYWHWSPVEKDVAYVFGRNNAGEGESTNTLYKVTVDIDTGSYSSYLEFTGASGIELSAKKGISSDGKKFIANDFYKTKWYPSTLLPSAVEDVIGGYTSNRSSYDDYWGMTDQRKLDVATYSTGTVTLNSGASGSVDDISIDSISIMSTSVSYNTSLDITATNIASNITAYTSSPNYTATATGGVITIQPTYPSAAANGRVVTSTTTTIGSTDADMSGGITAVQHYHDQYMTGAVNADNGVWFHILTEVDTYTWWKIRTIGSASDSGPLHTSDIYYPYVWGGEMEPTNTVATNGEAKGDCDYPNRDPWPCANQVNIDTVNYFSHYEVDRWGKFILYSNTGGASVGVGIWNEDTHQHEVEQFTSTVGTQHHDWSAWSDWSVSGNTGEGSTYGDGVLTIQNVNNVDSQIILSSTHIAVAGTDYNRYARPSQSPDGTKTTWHTSWMNTNSDTPDLMYTVAYYPYAPEITATSATGGTATIRFDWQNTLADPNPRTYTNRGWPSETTDDRPIPRETNKYRLWRSTDKTTWTPLSTVDANHFTRFDFADGGFKSGQDSFWEITDTPGDGTFYYAVTSIEHSGLESRSLSNIFSITISGGSGTGSQDTAYPTDPGGDSSFLTAIAESKAPTGLTVDGTDKADGLYALSWTEPADKTTVRYYNIYYSTAGTPTATQQNRIASVPAGTTSWKDWLASKTIDGNYTITSVDTQGNETGSIILPPTTAVARRAALKRAIIK